MSKNNLIYLIIGVIVLVGLFYLLKPKTPSPTETPAPSTSSAEPTASSSAQISNSKSFDLVVKNKKLVSGPDTLKVTEGDQVTINITSDEDEELHLHGYDKSVDLTKNQPSSLTFQAILTGRFPYELEKSKTEIGALEVQPK